MTPWIYKIMLSLKERCVTDSGEIFLNGNNVKPVPFIPQATAPRAAAVGISGFASNWRYSVIQRKTWIVLNTVFQWWNLLGSKLYNIKVDHCRWTNDLFSDQASKEKSVAKRREPPSPRSFKGGANRGYIQWSQTFGRQITAKPFTNWMKQDLIAHLKFKLQ